MLTLYLILTLTLTHAHDALRGAHIHAHTRTHAHTQPLALQGQLHRQEGGGGPSRRGELPARHPTHALQHLLHHRRPHPQPARGAALPVCWCAGPPRPASPSALCLLLVVPVKFGAGCWLPSAPCLLVRWPHTQRSDALCVVLCVALQDVPTLAPHALSPPALCVCCWPCL